MEELHEFDENAVEAEDSVENGLTGIPSAIHWPATQEPVEAEYHELDRIAVDNFLDTLANAAISIAAREHSENNDKERDE